MSLGESRSDSNLSGCGDEYSSGWLNLHAIAACLWSVSCNIWLDFLLHPVGFAVLQNYDSACLARRFTVERDTLRVILRTSLIVYALELVMSSLEDETELEGPEEVGIRSLGQYSADRRSWPRPAGTRRGVSGETINYSRSGLLQRPFANQEADSPFDQSLHFRLHVNFRPGNFSSLVRRRQGGR